MNTTFRIALTWALLAALAGCSKDSAPTSGVPRADRAPVLLAFMSERPPSPAFGADIWFCDLSKSSTPYLPRNLNTASLEGPCGLSADGKHLAFYTNRFPIGSSALLLLYDVRTGVTTVPHWTNTLNNVQNPSLSGDGRYLATQYLVSGFADINVAMEDLVGDSLLPLPNLNAPNYINFDPFVSADGKLVAFATDQPGSLGNYDIFLYSVPGDSMIPLPGLNSASSDLAPSISADSRYIAFQSGRPGGAGLIDVYVYDRQTASLVPLPGANTPLADYVPSISPDGRYLGYSTESEGGRDIRVYDLQAKRVLELPGLNDPYFYDYFPSLANSPP